MSDRRSCVVLGAWVLLVGCGAQAPAGAPQAEGMKTRAEAAKGPAREPGAVNVESAGQGGTPVKAETPAVEPGAAERARPVKPATSWVVPEDATLQLAGFRDGDLRLFRLEDEVVVASASALARVDGHGRLGLVEYALSGLADPGMPETWEVVALGGRWPDNTWLVSQAGFFRSMPPDQVYRREGNVWKPRRSKDDKRMSYLHVVDGLGGPVLGLRVYKAPAETDDEEVPLRVRRKNAAAFVANPSRFEVLGSEVTPATQAIAAGLFPVRAGGAATGELFLLATQGADGPAGTPVVQRWGASGAAATTGTVDRLPGASACSHLAVRTADEVYVGCIADAGAGALLLRFDGTSWSKEPAPKKESIESLSVARDGGLWAITAVDIGDDDEDEGVVRSLLWRRPARGAAWESVSVPEVRFGDRAYPEWNYSASEDAFWLSPAAPAEAETAWTVAPLQVVARAADDVWVAGLTRLRRDNIGTSLTEFRHVVLHSGPAQEPVHFLAGGNLNIELLDWRPASAWTPDRGCAEEPAFVALRTLPRDAPPNEPEPALETLVRDHAGALEIVEMFVEVFHRGRRTVGLVVKPKDQAGVDALLAALEVVAPAKRRALECRRPRIRRSFDRATGRALEAPEP